MGEKLRSHPDIVSYCKDFLLNAIGAGATLLFLSGCVQAGNDRQFDVHLLQSHKPAEVGAEKIIYGFTLTSSDPGCESVPATIRVTKSSISDGKKTTIGEKNEVELPRGQTVTVSAEAECHNITFDDTVGTINIP